MVFISQNREWNMPSSIPRDFQCQENLNRLRQPYSNSRRSWNACYWGRRIRCSLSYSRFTILYNYSKVCKINLVGKLKPIVTAKDIILEVLRRLTVKGGVSKVFEYGGEGVKYLSVPQRATITNRVQNLTTTIFPSDEKL